MAVTVETLGALERKITLTLSAAALSTEVETRLKKIAKTVKMSGFRPGKVPMSIVAQQYGYSAQYEVMNERVGAAFNAAVTESNLNVAGQPKISELEAAAGSDELKFEALFEVYPEVTIKDLSTAEIQKFTSEVSDAAIDKTVAILQKQRRSFAQRGMDAGVEAGDRVTTHHHPMCIRLTEYALERLADGDVRAEVARPMMMPMLIPPNPWRYAPECPNRPPALPSGPPTSPATPRKPSPKTTAPSSG